MPDSEVTYPRLAEHTVVNTTSLYGELRSHYNDWIRTLFDQERISSTTEVSQLKSWLDSIRDDPEAIEEALQNYHKHAVPLMHKELRKKSGAVSELAIAAQYDVISKQSHDEWIAWIEDISRGSQEKMASMAKTLPDYLARRRTLAVRRENLTGDPRFAELENSSDAAIRSKAKTLKSTSEFLNKLSIEEREELVVELTNALPLLNAEKKLFATFESQLNAVAGKYISQSSRKRWIARFKDPAVNAKDREKFVTKEFSEYVKRWKKVHKDRDELKKNPLFADLWQKDISDIGTFKKDATFLELHYKEKVDLVNRVRNAIIAKKQGKEKWNIEATNAIKVAAAAGYVSSNRVGELVNNMRESGRSIAEVKNFVKEWAKVRYRYDKNEERMLHGKVPQGLKRISLEQFLMMKWERRKSYVQEVEHRLDIENVGKGTSKLSYGLILKIRHELDSGNWDEAKALLQEAWTADLSEEDITQLNSMENYIKNFGGSDSQASPEQDKLTRMQNAMKKIDGAYQQLPQEVKPFYDHAFKHDSNCAWCIGVMFYNVQWGLERGYQPRDLSKVREKAASETPERMRPGTGHTDGLENNLIDGHGRPAIREEGWGPQNICASSSEAERVVESANANKNNFSYWYWNNLIVKGVSAGQYTNIAYSLRRQITSGMRELESLGENYYSARGKLGMNSISLDAGPSLAKAA